LLGVSFASEAQLNINHYIRVGRTRISIGNFTGAIEYFNIVIKFRPHLPEAYFFRGVSKHELEDYRGAINDYNKAIEIKPFYPQAYMNRGMAYHNLKLFEKAIEDYNKALEFDPDNESIYNNRGIAKLSLEDIEGAIADYNKALEINPKSTHKVITIRPHFASAYLNRGLARFEMEDYASALRDYDQCIKLEPENALAYNNRGIVKHKLEDYQGAIMDYNMALMLNPEMASAYFNRAMAREILGREGYEKDYRIAARLNPRFDLESRRLDARQLAQKQQSSKGQSQQGTGTSSATQGQAGKQQTAAKQQDNDKKEEEEKQQQRRSRINLIVEDTRDLPKEDEEADDGRIQNRNIAIDLQPVFIVSAFEKNSVDYERFQYYNMTIEDLNEKNNYNPLLTITNKPVDEYQEVFENFVLYYNARLEINKSSHNYLSRGIFRSLTGNYNAALEDLDSAIILDSEQAIAYFARGNCRYKMLEQIESLTETHDEVVVSVNEPVMDEPAKQPMAIPEYNKILNDYQTLLYLKSDFFFGYFNRAYIKLRLQRYKSAIEDLNKAIELEPEFAEAYFNRGLTKIFLNDIEEGALDLSRAGELGIYGAYNIIKRYCNQETHL